MIDKFQTTVAKDGGNCEPFSWMTCHAAAPSRNDITKNIAAIASGRSATILAHRDIGADSTTAHEEPAGLRGALVRRAANE